MHHRPVVCLLLYSYEMFARGPWRGHLIVHSLYYGCSPPEVSDARALRRESLADEGKVFVPQHMLRCTLSATRSTISLLNKFICEYLVVECNTDESSEPRVFVRVNVPF